MSNESPNVPPENTEENKPASRPHPLERAAMPPPPTPKGGKGRRVILHIPSVMPYATYALMAINIVVFVLGALDVEFYVNSLVIGATNASQVLQHGEYYRLFTAMFIHAGIHQPDGSLNITGAAHILFNMSVLYYIGSSIERIFGHARFLLIYILGGLTASLLSILLSFNAYGYGASGAIFAILGAEVIYLWEHRKLFGEFAKSRLKSSVILIALNLVVGTLNNLGENELYVGNWAHVGGLIGGLILAKIIAPRWILKQHPVLVGNIQAEDINPLNKNIRDVTLYVSGLMIVLIVAVFFANR